MPVTQMTDFPVQNSGQTVRIGHQIANPEIAVEKNRFDRFGYVIIEPAQCEREHRPVSAIYIEPGFQIVQQFAGLRDL